MNEQQYQRLAQRFIADRQERELLMEAAMGISGEAGEITDILKKITLYGKPVDTAKLLEEIGDECWYLNLLLIRLGSSWSEVFEMNIKKLEARYPDLRFDADKAINRNLAAELQAMGSQA